MKRFELSCWVFKSEELVEEENKQRNEAVRRGEERKIVRVTVDIPLVAENYVKANRRITKLTNEATGIEWNIPTRDLVAIIADADFEVRDTR